MGTYTTNYNLFMPTVGETGWGTLVNGNFSTIDTTMKSLSNRITTCESYGARITAVENEVNGALSCTSVTASGKITGNGGIAGGAISGTTGTFSGTVTASYFDGLSSGFTCYLVDGVSVTKPAAFSIVGRSGPCNFVSIMIPANVSFTNFPCILNKIGLDASGHAPVTTVINESGQQLAIDVPTGITLRCGNTTYSGLTNISISQVSTLIRNVSYISGTCPYSNQTIQLKNRWDSGVYMTACFV